MTFNHSVTGSNPVTLINNIDNIIYYIYNTYISIIYITEKKNGARKIRTLVG